MDAERFNYLYLRYQDRKLTDTEQIEWERALLDPAFDEVLQRAIDAEWKHDTLNGPSIDPIEADLIYHHIVNHRQRKSTMFRSRWLRYSAAAIAVLVISAVIWDTRTPDYGNPQRVTHVTFGQQRVMLKSPDGRQIDLLPDKKAIVMGDQLTYADGTLVDSVHASTTSGNYVLEVPRGYTYQAVLSDGTHIWLNSDSKLTYPAVFDGPTRSVYLRGEGYFEVSKQAQAVSGQLRKRPFVVKSDGQEIKVIGTQFNVAAHPDEPSIKTTLVEGSICVTAIDEHTQVRSNPVTLKPGQQSLVNDRAMNVREVDPVQQIAWRNGYFSFNTTPFPEAVRQLARWYDLEIIYRHGEPLVTISGKMKQDAQLSNILDFFQGLGIKCHLKGRKLIIE